MGLRDLKRPNLEKDEAQLKNMRQIFITFGTWCLLIGFFFDALVILADEFLHSSSVGFATFMGVCFYMWLKDNLLDLTWAIKVLWLTYLAR